MSKKIMILIMSTIITTFLIYLSLYVYKIKTATIKVILKNNLTLEFNDNKKVSNYIKYINGKIIDDYKINSNKLGKQEIKFRYINNDGIKVNYKFEINVVDTVKPVIWLNNKYKVNVGDNINLTDKILCGDNYDNNPTCKIEGEYDLNKIGNYNLKFIAIDNSGNKSEQEFVLEVQEPKTTNVSEEIDYINFNDIKNKYKKNNTKIGIDISKWQGDVDFQLLKKTGVEFIIIRVGYSKGTDGEYELDPKFKYNIEQANKYNIPVGVYFYSYANSDKKAKQDARWVLKQIKDYQVELPIAFDWEEWSNFNEYNLSFFGLTNMANTFIKTVEKKGYKGLMYSSKTYLENIWLDNKNDIWLAYYTNNNDYQGKIKMWQICDTGKVDGINTPVDIDILYN